MFEVKMDTENGCDETGSKIYYVIILGSIDNTIWNSLCKHFKRK